MAMLKAEVKRLNTHVHKCSRQCTHTHLSGALSHFCFNNFSYSPPLYISLHKKTALYLQFLNLILFRLHLVGTSACSDKRLMMRKHVEHRLWEPPENAIRGGFTGAAHYHYSTYLLMDCGYRGNDHCNKGSRAANQPLNICPNPEIRDLCTVCGPNEPMAHECPLTVRQRDTDRQ